jgi:hypothetical protein
VFFENLPRKSKFLAHLTRILGTLHENQNIYFIVSRSVLLRMRNVSAKGVEKIKTHTLCSIIFFFWGGGGDRAINEIILKNFCSAGKATDDNMAHAQCMLDT